VQYADEVVVVINLLPMKASNGVEDKTKETLCLSQWLMQFKRLQQMRRTEEISKFIGD